MLSNRAGGYARPSQDNIMHRIMHMQLCRILSYNYAVQWGRGGIRGGETRSRKWHAVHFSLGARAPHPRPTFLLSLRPPYQTPCPCDTTPQRTTMKNDNQIYYRLNRSIYIRLLRNLLNMCLGYQPLHFQPAFFAHTLLLRISSRLSILDFKSRSSSQTQTRDYFNWTTDLQLSSFYLEIPFEWNYLGTFI